MVKFKRRLENLIYRMLSTGGYSVEQRATLVKKIGRGLLLLSALIIVPLLIWDPPLVVKIAIQLFFACGMYIGSLLAFDEEK